MVCARVGADVCLSPRNLMEDAASASATGLHRHSRAHRKAAATIAHRALLRQSQRPVSQVGGIEEYTTRRMQLEAQPVWVDNAFVA